MPYTAPEPIHANPAGEPIPMRIAVVGATGLVGRAMLDLLTDRPWADDTPHLLASARSAGATLRFRGRELPVRDAAAFDPAQADLALFSAGGAASRALAPRFAAAGCWVVDNSSAWRMDPHTALVVPEINAHALPAAPAVVANPNCSTIQIVLPLAPLHRAWGLRELHASTYQSVSGGGSACRRALLDQLDARRPAALDAELGLADPGPFARAVAFDVVPEIGAVGPDGWFEEEIKVRRESRKILELPDLAVTCTAVRVPSWNGHGAAVRAVFAEPVDRDEAVRLLRESPGLITAADPAAYATPAEVTGADEVAVGRLRLDPDEPRALTYWCAGDNLRKGAALNAVQIAERILRGNAAR